MKHFTEMSLLELGILEDAEVGLLDADDMSVEITQRVYWLWLDGMLAGLKITEQGKETLKSLADFRESLKR